jgi:hypothetical protein
MSQDTPSLPANRAFVVQFRAQPTSTPLRWEGRVEHLVSWEAIRFHSQEELLAFITRILSRTQDSPSAQ